MKLKIVTIFLALINFANLATAAQHVRGYIHRNGTYAAPSFITKSKKTVLDNYSTKGNTGKQGYINHYNIIIPK